MQRNLMVIGERGSGKDTFADYLVKKHGYQKIRLAGYVVNACKAFGIENPTKTDLVFIATNIGRNMIDPFVWINLAIKDMKKQMDLLSQTDYEPKFVISDIRFHNEYETFIGKGFFPVVLNADKGVRTQRVIERDGEIDESLLSHPSETNFIDFSGFEIFNSGSIDDFYSEIDSLMRHLESDRVYSELLSIYKKLYLKRMNKI